MPLQLQQEPQEEERLGRLNVVPRKVKQADTQSELSKWVPSKHVEAAEIKQRLAAQLKKQGIDVPDATLQTIARLLEQYQSHFKLPSKVQDVAYALSQIAKSSGRSAGEALGDLANETLARLFISNLTSFVQISAAAKDDTEIAFIYLKNDQISELFAARPGDFVKIAKATGKSAGPAFGVLLNESASARYDSEPESVVEALCQIGKYESEFSEAFHALERKPKASELDWTLFPKAFLSELGVKFSRFEDSNAAKLFASHLDEIVQISKWAGSGTWLALRALNDEKITNLFESNPQGFVQIAKAAKDGAGYAFNLLVNPELSSIFSKNPSHFINTLADIAKASGKYTTDVFSSLQSEPCISLLCNYFKGAVTFDGLMTGLKATSNYSVEIGKILDELHNPPDQGERMHYLSKLSKTDILALAMSNPEYFYPSTNSLILDRLQQDYKSGSISSEIRALGLHDSEFQRNLMLRAAIYSRLYGDGQSIFNKDDMKDVLSALVRPLAASSFDFKYFYLLANTFGHMDESMQLHIRKFLEAVQKNLKGAGALQEWAVQKSRAMDFLFDSMKNPGKAAFFDASNFRGKDEKLLVVQIFDREDTESDHWNLTQQWFAKYGKPAIGDSGELIFENASTRVILFMGEDAGENQKFIAKMLEEEPGMVLTFRGHSFSLKNNLPVNIFANSRAKVLLIPGSCNSDGATADYIHANPGTQFDFVAYTSVGMGQVTNALVDIFITEARKNKLRTYDEIIHIDKANGNLIAKYGGDSNSLKVATLGERLLEYVHSGK